MFYIFKIVGIKIYNTKNMKERKYTGLITTKNWLN